MPFPDAPSKDIAPDDSTQAMIKDLTDPFRTFKRWWKDLSRLPTDIVAYLRKETTGDPVPTLRRMVRSMVFWETVYALGLAGAVLVESISSVKLEERIRQERNTDDIIRLLREYLLQPNIDGDSGKGDDTPPADSLKDSAENRS